MQLYDLSIEDDENGDIILRQNSYDFASEDYQESVIKLSKYQIDIVCEYLANKGE